MRPELVQATGLGRERSVPPESRVDRKVSYRIPAEGRTLPYLPVVELRSLTAETGTAVTGPVEGDPRAQAMQRTKQLLSFVGRSKVISGEIFCFPRLRSPAAPSSPFYIESRLEADRSEASYNNVRQISFLPSKRIALASPFRCG